MTDWEKLEIISKIIAAIFVPLAIGWAGNVISIANKQTDSEIKFVELATAILNESPPMKQPSDSKNIRRWAVDVINKYSGVPMSKETVNALVETTTLPVLKAEKVDPQETPELSSAWGVVFGGDKTLEDAKQKITASEDSKIYLRHGSFRSLKVFINRSEAEDALGRAKIRQSDSYIVNMGKWCPSSIERNNYIECASR
jgi:hypothetical protein